MKYRRPPGQREHILSELEKHFGEICWYCGISLKNQNKHIDHIVPVTQGGADEMDNFALTCGPCNYAKGMSGLGEFLDWLANLRRREFVPLIDPETLIHPISRLYVRRANTTRGEKAASL